MKKEIETVEVTWVRIAKVWWSFIWRTYVFSVFIFLPFGFMLLCVKTFITDNVVSGDTKVIYENLLSFLIFAILILVSFGVLQHVIKNIKFSDFEIVLCSKQPKDEQKQ